MSYSNKPTTLKFMSRAGIYQGSNYNVTFDPTKIEAKSYKWWTFIAVIENKVVFNSYRYSVTTSKHQAKMRSLLQELGIKIDLEVETSNSLSSANNSLEALEDLVIETLNDKEFNEAEKRQRRNERATARRRELAYQKELAKQVNNITQDSVPRLALVK